MPGWVRENGTLWAIDRDAQVPQRCEARVAAAFVELGMPDLAELVSAMDAADGNAIQRRFAGGRRCFGLRVDGALAAYGWVTHGAEYVGELEREFHLGNDESYIWDCATVAAWRSQRCYSALLSLLVHQLRQEHPQRIWIGASRQNRASIQGIVNAGFSSVLDLVYYRLARLTLMCIYRTSATSQALVTAAYRILRSAHERRMGPLLLGYRH